MSAVRLWVRADLRRRWRSWVVLGLLAGASVGLACAGIAGARRTERAVPHYANVSNLPDAAVLPNDPAFDDSVRAQLAERPEVEAIHPFVVPFILEFSDPEGLAGPLLPTTPEGMKWTQSPFVAGRAPAPDRADEIAINEQARDAFGLDIGSVMTLEQRPPGPDFAFPVPPRVSQPIEQQLRVVGVMDGAGSEGPDVLVSSGFYDRYRDQVAGPVNAMVELRNGLADLETFRADVDRLMGRPVNVESVEDLFGIRQIRNVSDVESTGLWLFALTVLVGAGALVGQALVRAVGAGASDIDRWRAIGADRKLARRAMVAPAALVALVAMVTTIVVAVLLSPRFPIALTRRFELDVGFHADWAVLLPAALALGVLVMLAAWVTADLRLRRTREARPSRIPRAIASLGMPPALTIGSQLASDTGRGHRAVPVRSALFGAIVGVLGVVSCLTFRAGLSDTVNDPSRSGVVWEHVFAKGGQLSDEELQQVGEDPAVAESLHATWARAVPINGTSTPTFGVAPVRGDLSLVVLSGRAPTAPDEIAFGPTTMDALDLDIGDDVTVGSSPERRVHVVGRALMPATSHTDYDQTAWMTRDGLMAVLPDVGEGDEFFEDYLLLRWQRGADVAAAQVRLQTLAASGDETFYESAPAELPPAVQSLRALRVVPLELAIFFALLAIATVAHALVTTVRRRRADLAILRSIGFTKRDARIAIGWQATLIALVGVVIGVPLGVLVGRLLWRQLAASFPIAYVPPLALLAIVLVAPAAIAVANILAVGPAHSATRVRPASVLRAE